MINKIYIARHGFRLNWLTTNWTSKTGLPRDPPLAAFGEEQARELAEHFKSLPLEHRPTAIFSSPYYRCLQTAQPTSIALGIPIYVEHGIAEWYSPVVPGSGFHPRPASATSLREYFSEVDDSWSSVWYPPRVGEEVEEVHNRADGALKALLFQIEKQFPGKHQNILLVSHAATVIALARSLVQNNQLALRVGCSTISEFDKVTSPDGYISWTPLRLADGTHLKEGSKRDWGFEDIEISSGKVVEDPGDPGTEVLLNDSWPTGLQIQLPSSL